MKQWILLLASTILVALPAHAKTQQTCPTPAISASEVKAAQKAWAEGIVDIGKVYTDKGDYKARAAKHISDLYAYDSGKVLFKPTLASADQFRESFDEALDYFIGKPGTEDAGFAIRPWSKVRFGEQDIITDKDSALAMGNYYFTPLKGGDEVKVEYTLGYVKDAECKVRINLQHSSLPYTAKP